MNIEELERQIEQQINSFLSQMIYHWALFEQQWWWAFGAIGGLSLIAAWVLHKKLFKYPLFGVFILSILSQPLLYLSLPTLSKNYWGETYIVPDNNLYMYAGSFTASALVGFFIFRYLIGWIDELKHKFIKTTELQREQRSDIRNVNELLPRARKEYNPLKYFKINKGIFLGLNKNGRPVYINANKWRSSHVEIVGTTGSGKGVAAGVLLAQAVRQGESACIIDPKNDEFLPHVLGHVARDTGVPFFYIDLLGKEQQWNPFFNKSVYEIEELFAAGFELSEKGTDADFYRLNDRKAARAFAKYIVNSNNALSTACSEFVSTNSEMLKDAPKFQEDLKEIASVQSTNISHGLDLKKAIEQGAIIYVRGSMRNPRILKLQKMFVLSVMQYCENRERDTARHVCIFLDEFKYLISRPSLQALGAIRDKRAHVIIAHQSLGDLRDCSNDIDPESVVASINENCSLKLTYQINDPDTADWLARMSGKILVDDELRGVITTRALTETRKSDRLLRQTERCLIDTNMLQSLPLRCCVLYGNGLADFIFTSPIKVTKRQVFIQPTIFANDDATRTISGPNDGKNISMAEALVNVD